MKYITLVLSFFISTVNADVDCSKAEENFGKIRADIIFHENERAAAKQRVDYYTAEKIWIYYRRNADHYDRQGRYILRLEEKQTAIKEQCGSQKSNS